MTDRDDPEGPRLPPSIAAETPRDDVQASRWPIDLGPVDTTEAELRRLHWVDYEEPELLSLRRARLLVLAVRVLVAAWAMSMVVAAAILRSSAGGGPASTRPVWVLAVVGMLLGLGVAASGWFWTDRATQDVHRLSARLPSRTRCVSAWTSAVVWAGVSCGIVFRLDPTEPADIRPLVVWAILAVALWRPYSLVRRIVKSLIRVDSDLAVGSAFLLDLACIGLLSSRLADLPGELDPARSGQAGTLLGLAAVAAVAAVGNVAIWYQLLGDVDRAVEHRRVAMRTRHGHRQLRLAGIDPLDPKVRLALLIIQRESARSESDDEPADEPLAETDVASSTPELRADAAAVARRVETTPDLVADAGDEEVPEPVSGEVEEVPEPVPGEVEELVEPVSISGDDQTTPDSVADAGELEELVEPVSTSGDVEEEAEPASASVDAEEVAEPVARDDDPVGRIAARLRPDLGTDPTRARRGAGRQISRTSSGSTDREMRNPRRVEPPAVGDKLRDRLASAADAHAEASAEDRVDRLFGRLGGASFRGEGRSIVERLERLGIEAADTAVPEDGTGPIRDVAPEESDHGLTLDRLHSLELARYLLVIALAVNTAASVWFVARSVDVAELASGAIDPAGLDRLEMARLATVRALDVALAMVPLWCAVAARWANRVGLVVRGTARCAALTGVAGALVVVAFLADATPVVLLSTTIGCLGAALWSIPVMIDVERSIGRSTTIPSLLPLALAFGVLTAWIGRLLRPVSATDSLEAMSFFGGLLALVMAMSTVIAVVSSIDVVEAIRLSPTASGRWREAADRDDP